MRQPMRHSKALIEFIQKNNIKILAEVGIERGRLLRTILRSPCKDVIDEYWAIDPWRPVGLKYGEIMGRRTRRDWFDIFTRVSEYMIWFKQLRVLRMNSVDAANNIFPDKYFDLVYIDADHSTLAVLDDINAWIPKIKDSGYLAGHDYNIGGVQKAVNQLLSPVDDMMYHSRSWLKKISDIKKDNPEMINEE